ncbi:MAG: apolipoprotein N-acyltransferase [Sphingosinicella sp.]|uniref:apolipoprotein N-acyltransferase n=1 Tax=Sphingosinicella sp. TaxID=1917971 RepID=UPI0040381796
MRHLSFAFFIGLIGAFGFAPWSLWPVTLAAFALLLWLIETAPNLRSALARGWWFGVGQFALGLNWIATAFTYQAAMPAWLGWIAVVLLSLYLAVFPAAAAGLAWRWGRKQRLALVLILAAAWIVTEWLRATLFTGFAWNPVAVALVPSGLAGIAQWIGTYALSGVAVLFGGALFLAAHRGNRTSAALLLAGLSGGGAAPGAAGPSPAPTGTAIRIVQPNIGQQNKWDPGFEAENFRRLAALTGRPEAEPRLILWPEAATPDFLSIEPGARRRIAALIGPNDLLLLGGVELVFDAQGEPVAAYNSLFTLDPQGRLRGRYDKAHLVPYGEYLPMRPFLSAIGISRLAPGTLDFLSGSGPRTLDLPGFGRAGVQVCYEIIFSGQVVDRGNRPDFIFNPSNDAWFGAWGPPQHLAQARLRAIEEGLPVLRATPTGISAVIDAQGRLLASIPQGQGAAITGRLPAGGAPTLFARFGNLLAFIFAALLVAAAIAVRRKSG